jgi:hypothetical protein
MLQSNQSVLRVISTSQKYFVGLTYIQVGVSLPVTSLLHFGSFDVTEDFYNALNLNKEPPNGNEQNEIDNRT